MASLRRIRHDAPPDAEDLRLSSMLKWSLIGLALVAPSSTAQTWPTKPIRLIVSSAPKGGTDTIARIAANALSESLSQQIVVDNRPGANGQIALSLLAKSPPDGHTLLMHGAASMVIHPHTYAKLPYDLARDFLPVGLMAASDYILSVHPSLPVKTVGDLVLLARAQPGQIAFSSSGLSSLPHLAGELFKLRAKVDMLHVPYKGGGPAALAILSGEVALMFGTGPTVVHYGKSGKLRLIATASEQRSRAMPDLPTVGETVPGVVVTAWYGMTAPAGTPTATVSRLNAEIAKAVANERVAKAIVASGLEPVTKTPEAFATYIKTQTASWGEVVRAAGLRAE